MRAVIPVAGVGTRLRPHTYSLPKVLLNVAGKPILAHILDSILEQNINKATIITGYMGDLVEEYVQKRYPQMSLDFVEQKERLGLGHAIWTGKSTYGTDELMIILGDTIFDVDLKNALDSNSNSIGVRKVEDPKRFGVVIKNDDGTIQKLVEKPEHFISDLAIVGIYYIKNTQKLVESLDYLIDNNMLTRGEFQLTDALQRMLESGEKFITFPVDGWYDCGKPETLLSTNRFLLDRKPNSTPQQNTIVIPPVFISDKATVVNSVIGPYTSIADDAIVEGSIIENSIISFGAKVKSSLLIESIIGNNAEVEGHFKMLNVGDSSQILDS